MAYDILFDGKIDDGVIIVCVIIAIVVGAIAISSVFKVSDQIVQSSGSTQLQAAYQTGKEMINTAGNVKDGSDLAKSVGSLGK